MCNDFAFYEFNALLSGSASNPLNLPGSQSGVVKKSATSQTSPDISDTFSESKSGIFQNNGTSKPTTKTSDTCVLSPFEGKLIMFALTTESVLACLGA